MDVSVAMATRDGVRFLDAMLESLVIQTRPPQELCVCDDDSTDRTVDLLMAFSARAPFPVKVLQNDRQQGPTKTFLRAAAACRFSGVAFADQDDVWLPSKLERCADELEGRGVMLVVHSSRVVDEGLVAMGGSYPRLGGRRVLEQCQGDPWFVPPGFTVVVRSEVLRQIGNPEGVVSHVAATMPHDQWAWLVATSMGRVVMIGDELALYRQHGQNTVGYPRRRVREQVEVARRAGGQEYGRLASTARAQADYFRNRATKAGCRVVAERWWGLSERLMAAAAVQDRRALLYAADGAVARGRAFWRRTRAGDYANRGAGGPDLRSLLKDLGVAVLGTRVLR